MGFHPEPSVASSRTRVFAVIEPLTPLAGKVVIIHERLNALDVRHAFGGAIAFAYYGEPRVTVDIDVNVFVGEDHASVILDALYELGVEEDTGTKALIERDGQARTWWDRTPLDLFFAYDAFHFAAAARTRSVPFRETTIPILSATDLLVCKTVFDRPKDWADIEQMLFAAASEIDFREARSWVAHIVGEDDGRTQRFDDAVERVLGEGP